ncbi:translational GTPase TypA [Hyphomicrobium sulfonivorans]|uniref:Large ribosomal subunit assembly factor BipA n=1 Tax=Hyphomicrobium sulfonivorans TaxID=121290 RepID=A0A120CUJ5_HYPSL|nr:translational GTPase TypA [Hyphomicrobium sulfonivorans]KWT66325.1 GTP-binding protein TypA/BipA [Hyphomicrobium sulfonivorans]MBI1648526.1 translational GTPase TypA [Hyphomicrobium sulfonivorans]NSL70936.1 translational GTPase TypA [Hyphomicrobium sulfonivorans]
MNLRNIAIIAHVDHGKTTLVDELLKQSGSFREGQRVSERAMDSGDIERERGITILAKCTSVIWKDTRINIVDTPGHADFGGEVERIMNMVDGVVVLVDASEGPLPQTKFVVSKALKRGLRPIVAINKIDRPDERHQDVLNEVFDLFANLDATDEQLDFPVLYGSGRNGWMALDPSGPQENMAPMFDLVVSHVPPPTVDTGPVRVLATTLDADPFLGRILTGRITSGVLKTGMPLKALNHEGKLVENFRVQKVLAFRGLERVPVDQAEAGEIVSIAGMTDATVADTLCDPSVQEPLPAQPVDPPTLSMTFRINDGPFAGQEGDKVQSRVIHDRLRKEAETNIAIKVTQSDDKDSFDVAGRGELQLGILIENMRREGFELTVSRPKVVMKTDEETGARLEPIEEVIVDVDEEFTGVVVQKLSERKGELLEMRPSGAGRQRMVFLVPTRGLIGYQNELLSDTRGTAVMNKLFHSYAPHKGDISGRRTGVLISNANGEAAAYAIFNLQDRGPFLIGAQTRVYEGMIVGEHTRDNDLEVNVVKGKKLTNMRASGKDENVLLTPPMKLPLERALSYINDDELVEVTPQNIRLRKRWLDPNERKKMDRARDKDVA